MLLLFGGPAICELEVGDATVLQVWVLAFQRSENGRDSRVVKSASEVIVWLIIGVSGSGSLDWSLGSMNVDG